MLPFLFLLLSIILKEYIARTLDRLKKNVNIKLPEKMCHIVAGLIGRLKYAM